MAAAPEIPQVDRAERIAREQTRLAFGTWVQYVDGVAFSSGIVVAMCGAVPALGHTPLAQGLMWLAAAWLWALGASRAARLYYENEAKRSHGFWRALLGVIWMLHALVWGSVIFVFWDGTNPVNQAVLCTVIMAVMVSYFFVLAPCFPILLIALFTIAASASLQFWICGGVLSQVFLIALPLFVVVLGNYGRQADEKYRAALTIRFDKEALAEALETASSAKSGFLASMSHELRTPLNAIMGYADLMRQETFGPIAPARYKGYLEDIHASGAHLLGLINDLLDLAKIEAGKKELHFVPVSLAQAIDDAIKLVTPQAERARVDVMTDLAQTIVVEADERAVKQRVTNLLSNAVKFSKPGGIAVVYAKTVAEGGVALGVKDTGIGMTQDEQRRAIEPFAQGSSNAETVEGRGTGLGLPIVKGLIEAHGGALHIESAPGRGSNIAVTFPPVRVLRVREIEDATRRRLA